VAGGRRHRAPEAGGGPEQGAGRLGLNYWKQVYILWVLWYVNC
jgi:hypothetical protein